MCTIAWMWNVLLAAGRYADRMKPLRER